MGGQEVRLHRDGDSADLLIVYERVTAAQESQLFRMRDNPKNLIDATRWAERFLEGRRVGTIGGWPLAFDLDDPEAMAEVPAALREALADVSLDGHGAFLDDEGRLCGWQKWSIPSLAALVGAADRAFRDHLSALARTDRFAEQLGFGDDATVELFRARLADGRPFLRFVDGALLIDVPVSPTLRRRLLADGVEALAAGAANAAIENERQQNPKQHAEICRIITELLDHVRKIVIDDDRVELTIDVPGGRPTILLDLERDEEPYDDVLLDILRANGHEIETAFERESLIATWPQEESPK